jgi:hypothetical protein
MHGSKRLVPIVPALYRSAQVGERAPVGPPKVSSRQQRRDVSEVLDDDRSS